MNNVYQNIKNQFVAGSMLVRLIYINVAVWLAVILVDIVMALMQFNSGNIIINWFSCYSGLRSLALRPWGLLTYMFLHHDFLHLLFNMLWLYWFGQIFTEYFKGRQLLNVYLVGGLAGAVLFVLCYNVFPAFSNVSEWASAIGASAAVYAVVVAAAVYVPNYTMNLLLLGPVKIKWIAVFAIVSDLAFMLEGNTGGHIAHLGGALFGWCYIVYMQRGIDITRWFSRLVESFEMLFKPKPKMKVEYGRPETDRQYNNRKHAEQQQIDAILEKIAKSGYDALTAEEKEILFSQSRNNKQ
ncbi:MAG: rhomboid family intramembrane serine protease [Salinivirgaceae bacterium]|nr:rhomboid family intramembrane serine protease [Salinivirgaceae bacterium]